MGTGRCGTVSISELLNKQPNCNSRHEHYLLPWIVDSNKVDRFIKAIYRDKKHENHFEVTSSYLTSVPTIHILDKSIKFACLKRNKDDVVKSFIKKVGKKHHWTCHDDREITPHWDCIFPTYDTIHGLKISLKNAISLYWDEYYRIAEQYEKLYPEHFKIFNTHDVLNNKSGQISLFDFFELSEYNIILNIKKNSAF